MDLRIIEGVSIWKLRHCSERDYKDLLSDWLTKAACSSLTVPNPASPAACSAVMYSCTEVLSSAGKVSHLGTQEVGYVKISR